MSHTHQDSFLYLHPPTFADVNTQCQLTSKHEMDGGYKYVPCRCTKNDTIVNLFIFLSYTLQPT